jgi:hypothetical protein
VPVVEVAFWKWPHTPHYHHDMRLLGEDDNAVWGVCEAGGRVDRGGEFAFVRPTDYLMAIPRTGCWSALWYPPDDVDREAYVNVNSTPVWTGHHVDIIDLDFDLLRMRDGAVAILDEDEFERHRLKFAYPDEIVAEAHRGLASLREAVSRPDEPFGLAWRDWYRHLFGEVPETA